MVDRSSFCTCAQVHPSTARRCASPARAWAGRCPVRPLRGWACVGADATRLVACWVELVATASTWLVEAGEDVGPVVSWLVLVGAWRAGEVPWSLLVVAAQSCRTVGAWRLVGAVRAAMRAAWRLEVLRGRISLREACPFGVASVYPLAFGAEVLEASAEGFGLTADDARAEFREVCARHGFAREVLA